MCAIASTAAPVVPARSPSVERELQVARGERRRALVDELSALI
jgi:hypothetical protein